MVRLLVVLACVAAALAAVPSTASAAYENLLAPESTCPDQSSTSLPVDAQEATMLCMINYARGRSGLTTLSKSALLMDSAQRKGQDLVRCGQFTHTACGLTFDQRIRDIGYAARSTGENLAWGTGSLGSARRAMTGWLNSAGHRANILRAGYRDHGVALVKGPFLGYANAQLWVSHLAAPR